MMNISSVLRQEELGRILEFSLFALVHAFKPVTESFIGTEADLNKYQGLVWLQHDEVDFTETASIVTVQYTQAVLL